MWNNFKQLLVVAALASITGAPTHGRAQSEANMQIQIEQLNHCTDLQKTVMKLEQGEQAISAMLECANPTVVCSDAIKADLQNTIGPLETQNSIYDLGQLEKKQLEDIADALRELLGDCSDLPHDRSWEAMQLEDLGDTLIKLQEADDAIPILLRCGSSDPDFAGCFEKLGEAYQSLGKNEEAKAAFKHAISIGGFDQFNAEFIARAKTQLAGMGSIDQRSKKAASGP